MNRARGSNPRFPGFEPTPLATVLEAFAAAHGRNVADLRPRDRVSCRAALAAALARRGLAADLDRLRTLRAVVGALVPLGEDEPNAHH